MELQVSAIEKARMGMQGRILRCPLGDDNPEDCPLHEVRTWPMENRLAWLDAKTDEEVVELFILHTTCLEHKLSEKSSS